MRLQEQSGQASKLNGKKDPATVYFENREVEFFSTGCTLLDCVLGEGWPLGRIVNIVGDKAVGKTLLAIEAAANLATKYPKAKIWYREAEAAFDVGYAKVLGLPVDRVDFGADGPGTLWGTMEEVFDDLQSILDKMDSDVTLTVKKLREKNKRLSESDAVAAARKAAPPGLYIIDSLDALSSEAELERDVREGSYNLEKQKVLGQLFRQLVRRLKQAKICVVFISQIRDRIGAQIRGKKYTRAGGKSLDFYASLVIYLSHLETITRTVNKIKRAVGVKIKAKCEKNKITVPFRECTFPILFGYGIDDEAASIEWLEAVNSLPAAGLAEIPENLDAVDGVKLSTDVKRIWREIESRFMPQHGKYAR